ncbi:major facilitator superfamily domain-containing protein [Phlyctochytrium arcticum]|nr:major facilitator superfamily domain-containing protein [Phlyctochytrium arcticum]
MLQDRQLPEAAQNRFVRKTLKTVFCALLIDILAFTIILPLFPRILEHYDKTDGHDPLSTYSRIKEVVQGFRIFLGLPEGRLDIVLYGGILGSLFSFLQFISSPVIGFLSDRYGRRNVLLLSMIGNAASMLLWIFSKSFGMFIWSRVIGGLSEGNVQMSIAMISDITTPQTRSRGLALVGIAFSLGFTVGPPLGAYLTTIDLAKVFPVTVDWDINTYSSPALFAFVLIVVESLYLAAALPETSQFKGEVTSSPAGKGENESRSEQQEKVIGAPQATSDAAASAAVIARRQSNLRLLNMMHFAFLFFFSGMEFTLTFLTHDRFQFSHAQQGALLGYMGVISALVQGGYTRRMAGKRVSERTIAIQGITACGIGLATQGLFAWNTKWLFVGATFLAFTSGTVVTSLTALASYETQQQQQVIKAAAATAANGSSESSQRHDVGDRGRILGTFRSIGQLGRSLGPLFGCSTYWVLGSVRAYLIAATAMFILATMIRISGSSRPASVGPSASAPEIKATGFSNAIKGKGASELRRRK